MSGDRRQYIELEEYIKQGEPEQAEKSKIWQTAIGLQDVDGLTTSAYLLATAKVRERAIKRRTIEMQEKCLIERENG